MTAMIGKVEIGVGRATADPIATHKERTWNFWY